MKHKFKFTRLWVASLLLLLGFSQNAWAYNGTFYCVPKAIWGTYWSDSKKVRLNVRRGDGANNWITMWMSPTGKYYKGDEIWSATANDFWYDHCGNVQFQRYNGDTQEYSQECWGDWKELSYFDTHMRASDWIDYSIDDQNLYQVDLNYSFNGSSHEFKYYKDDKDANQLKDLGTLDVNSTFTLTSAKWYCWANWSPSTIAKMGYNIGSGDQSLYTDAKTATSNYTIEKNSWNQVIASGTDASGVYTFTHWWYAEFWRTGSKAEYYMSNNNNNYKFKYTILPPAVTNFVVTKASTAPDVKAGDGSENNPYIIKYGGSLPLSASSDKAHEDANSHRNYKFGSGSYSTTNTSTISNITSSSKQSITVNARCINSTASLNGSESSCVVYYQAETLYTVTVGKTVGGTVSPEGDLSVGAYTSKTLTATNNIGYHFVNWTTTGGANLTSTSEATTTLTASAMGTVTANFEPNTYVLNYSGSNIATCDLGATGVYNTDVTVTATATTGYVITGIDGVTPKGAVTGLNTNQVSFTFTVPANDVTVAFTTALGKVNLNFGAGANGSLIAKIGDDAQTTNTQINGGSVVDFTATPDAGYKVEGWYSDSGFDTKIDESKETTRQITANADVNVYVKFEPIIYTITYKNTYGVTHTNQSTYTIETETITFTDPTSNRTGYDFAGWSPATISKGSYGNQDVTANWTAHTYTVHFDANSTEGISGSMVDQDFTYDQNQNLTACGFTKQGYTFAGWATTSGGSVAYSNEQSVSNLTADNNATVTLYAKWTPANFTLDLNTNKTNDMFNVQVNNQLTLTASATLNSQPYTLDLNHYNYSYKKGNDGDFTAIIEQTGTSTNWTPTEIGTYTIRVEYTDGTITGKTKDITVYVWDNYTIYVWDPTIYAKRVHIWNDQTKKSLHSWTDSAERMTDKSSEWGNYWYSFTLQYPLYDAIKVHLEAATDQDGDNTQSGPYKFTNSNLPTDHQYLKVINESSKNWGWESAEAPQKPVITLTQKEVTVPSTKIKVEIKISPKYSPLTSKFLTIDGTVYDVSEFDNINGGTKTIELNNLAGSSEHTFVVSATNALGTTEETQTITTLAKQPITFMIKVANELFGSQGWGTLDQNVGINYWLADAVNHYEVLTLQQTTDEYHIYYYTFEDSPVSFYIGSTSVQDPSGDNRSANWNNAAADGCALVWTDKDGMNNRKITTQDYCTTRYQLVYTNTSNYKTYSNIIEDKDETLSLFVALDGTLEMKKYDPATAKWIETPVFTTSKRPSTAGVYNLNLVNVTDFEHITEANLSDFTAYTGKYYIRTDAATGGWQEYLFADKDNAMTQFTPRRDKGEDYSYYWVKNVAKNGTVRVSACVGNEFNPDLANMLTYDDFVRKGDDNHGYIDKLDGVGANVRFSYEPTTNEFKRAIIGGSSANNFLNVYSNDENLYATKNGEELSNLLNDLQKEAAISRFNDVSDWVYEKVVYVKVANTSTAANVILQSKFNSQTNYLLGYESDKTTPKPLEVLGTGTNPDTYTIRITYDYKKNRLMASWEPGTIQISANQSINTDILFIQREDANGAIDDVDVAQITYTPEGITNEAKLTSLKNIMYVLEVTPQVIKGTAADNQEYWITLPFDCRVSDVFGVEDYVKLDANGNAVSGTWGIMRYDGATRASHGWFLDDYSTFWRWMTRDETMHAGEGYVVIFDKTHANSWPSINVDGVDKQVKRLYFPSMNTGFTVSYSNDDSKVTYTNNPCTVEKRGDQDSNWKVLGPVSYNNIGVDNTKPNNLTFYYTYDQSAAQGSRYSEKQTITESNVFKSFHSFMTQFGGDLYWKPFTKSEDATTLKAPLYTENSEFQGGLLTIELNDAQGKELNHTFINLSKNGTTGFDRNLDLMKITENCAQIASVSEDVLYAGSTLPLDIELVPLNVKVVANGTYDIALEKSLGGLEVNLFDAFEQTTTPLDMMSATVTLNKGEYKDRFYLQLKQKSGETPTSFEGKIEQYNLPTDKTQKLLINDNIYLINAGRIYNASGTQVK